MLFLLLLQAASPAASAPPAQQAEWVVLSLAALATVGNIVLAVIRRGSNAKAAARDKAVKDLGARVEGLAAQVAAFEAKAGEHRELIDDIDERVSSPEMVVRPQQFEQRLATIERAIAAETAAREARREAQHKQEIELARELTRMSENVKQLAQQVERFHGTNSVR